MPHAGIPSEVADEILELVRDDTPTLVACCRASRGLCARARPFLYDKLEMVYRSYGHGGADLLSRSSANLVDTLDVNPELGQLCRELRIRRVTKEPPGLASQHTEPISETMRQLFERVPNLVSFILEEQDELFSWISRLQRTVVEVLQGWQGWTHLRRLRLPRIEDDLLCFMLGLPELAVLQAASASTANSQQSLVRLHVPYSFDLDGLLAAFASLRYLCLDFSSYILGGYTSNRERLQKIKYFLGADTRLTTLRFSSPEAPRFGRIRVLHSALPRNLERLILQPWPLVTQDALRCLEGGVSKQLWPSTLARVVWPSASPYQHWSSEDTERVRSKCLEYGIANVQFLPAYADFEA